jgi:hypothetical protein
MKIHRRVNYPALGSFIEEMSPSESFTALTNALKVASAALREAEVPFVLGGSLATWARGGPEPQNDLDLMVKPQSADAALQALAEAGMRTERPPEEWLYKAWCGDALVDVIFYPSGLEIDDDVLARADIIPVMAVATPVMALEDVLVTMICAIDEHTVEYSRLIAIARSLREQIDWPRLWARTSGSPYAKAFAVLVGELGIGPRTPIAGAPPTSRVRVVPNSA